MNDQANEQHENQPTIEEPRALISVPVARTLLAMVRHEYDQQLNTAYIGTPKRAIIDAAYQPMIQMLTDAIGAARIELTQQQMLARGDVVLMPRLLVHDLMDTASELYSWFAEYEDSDDAYAEERAALTSTLQRAEMALRGEDPDAKK